MEEWNKMRLRKLNRNGFCSCCGIGIVKDRDTVITFMDTHHQNPTVILCKDCINKICDLKGEKL